MLSDLGKKDASTVSVEDATAITKAFSDTKLNGDGVVHRRARPTDADLTTAIERDHRHPRRASRTAAARTAPGQGQGHRVLRRRSRQDGGVDEQAGGRRRHCGRWARAPPPPPRR
jgi:hypothetical protein